MVLAFLHERHTIYEYKLLPSFEDACRVRAGFNRVLHAIPCNNMQEQFSTSAGLLEALMAR